MRRAFTLVEMLVAVAIIVVLLGIVLYFMPKRESVATRDTAGKLEAYIAGAKARAVRENRAITVRLLSTDNGLTFTKAIMVDNGEDFMPPQAAGTFLELPNGATIATPAQNTARQFGFRLQGTVEVGDYLELHEHTPGSVHKITAIDFTTNTMTLQAQTRIDPITNQPYVDGIPGVSSNASTRLPNNYKYIRSPRPLMGEQGLEFNKDVFIRGVGPVGTVPTSLNIPRGRNGDWEITFSPSGQIIGNNGRIVLWIADTNNVAKPVLLTLYPTSGMKSHDVGPAGNEFQFTMDGR